MPGKEAITAAKKVLAQRQRRDQPKDPDNVVVLPGHAWPDLCGELAINTKRECRQIVVVDDDTNESTNFELLLWRRFARSDRACKKIYLLPHVGFRSDWVQTQANADQRDNVEVRFAYVSQLPEDSVVRIANRTLILDGEVIVHLKRRTGSSSTDRQIVVSQQSGDLNQAELIWEQLLNVSEDDPLSSVLNLEEPLIGSADLLSEIAPVLCSGDHVDDTECGWYHGTWQYLRLLDLVSTPTWHHDFYTREISNALTGDEPSVFISGTADYSILAYIHSSSPENTQVYAIDLCPTPLFACSWYAKRNRIQLHTERNSIFSLVSSESFDLVCCDAFLTRFSRVDAERILSIWFRLLKPGGRVVTTVRVYDAVVNEEDSEDEIQRFRDRAVTRARRWEPFIKRSADEIGSLAENYARSMRSSSQGNTDNITELFEITGFSVSTELASVPGELRPTSYLRIVAEKADG